MAAPWRVARCLDVLLDQIDRAHPDRSTASDGAIGNAEHASRDSDHNPWYGPGIVTARDFTHDPDHGLDIDGFTDELIASRDRRIKYVIANGLIASSTTHVWRWRKYSGPNAHRKHFHLSVRASPLCDDTSPWNLPSLRGTPAAAPTPVGVLRRGSRGPGVTRLQRVLAAWYPALRLAVDGDYGPATEAAVRSMQANAGLPASGVADVPTLRALHLA